MDRVMAVLDGAEHQHSADQGYPPGTNEYALGTPDDPSRAQRPTTIAHGSVSCVQQPIAASR